MSDGGERAAAGRSTSDVLILLRSPGAVLHHYTRALDEAGHPLGGRRRASDFFATTEVSVWPCPCSRSWTTPGRTCP